MGKIDRKSFKFRYSKVEVWQNGNCIFSDSSGGLIESELKNNTLNVTAEDSRLTPHMKCKFSFDEISTNGDRIMWSKDLLNTRDTMEKYVPDISSLFYHGGVLSKVTFTIHDPNILVEFHK
jgi:hypothetical protein